MRICVAVRMDKRRERRSGASESKGVNERRTRKWRQERSREKSREARQTLIELGTLAPAYQDNATKL